MLLVVLVPVAPIDQLVQFQDQFSSLVVRKITRAVQNVELAENKIGTSSSLCLETVGNAGKRGIIVKESDII